MKKIIITCEHGGNEIPEEFRYLFSADLEILTTHRGWDPGALDLAQSLSNNLNVPLFYSKTSRLLIELNRSLHHPALFSGYIKDLEPERKKKVIIEHYLPYRNTVEKLIKESIEKNYTVIHISVHSFTPVLNNVVRNCDIGLLYDPTRNEEKNFCQEWKNLLVKNNKDLKVRFNYPYKGTADGFTTYLRKSFLENYVGIELEVNQKIISASMSSLKRTITNSLLKLV